MLKQVWPRMGRRVWVARCSLALFCSAVSLAAQTTSLVAVPVIARDGKGNPVNGLTAAEFTVWSDGERLPVLRVLRSATLPTQRGSLTQDARTGSTKILALLPPMGPKGLHQALRSARRGVAAMVRCCDVALMTPDGRETGFTRDSAVLESALREGGRIHGQARDADAWSASAKAAVTRLGDLPGRHVVLLANSTWRYPHEAASQSIRPINPLDLLRVLLAAQASVYSVETDGPQGADRFGDAVDAQTYTQGPATLQALGHQLAGYAAVQGQTLQIAEATGGFPVTSFIAAADAVARDNQGYYLLVLQPAEKSGDDSWHNLSVAVDVQDVTAGWGHYYFAPGIAGREAPAALMDAVDMPVLFRRAGGPASAIAMQHWFFPDGARDGRITMPFALSVAATAPVEVYIRLMNASLGLQAGAWYVPPSMPVNGRLLRQFASSVTPGEYRMDVVTRAANAEAMDHATRQFVVRSAADQNFAVSSLVLYDHCAPAGGFEQGWLEDPLTVDGCTARLVPQPHFSTDGTVRLLLRTYPITGRGAESLLANWDGRVLVDGRELPQDGGAPALQTGTPQGLLVQHSIDLTANAIAAGRHEVEIVMSDGPRRIVLASAPMVVVHPVPADR